MIHHLVVVSSVGALYIWSAEQIKRGAPNGIEGALGKAFDHYQGWLVYPGFVEQVPLPFC